MTTELMMLILTTILAASLWIPFIIGVNTSDAPEGFDPFVKPPNFEGFPLWVQRARRAHLNLIEQFVPFAVIVLIAHTLSVSTPVTVWACIAFFALRIAHAVGMITAITRMPARPIIFTLGWVMILLVTWQVIAHG